ncbi:unnamed protein product [Durusdinium trenchii]|uniref:Apple domain-containing protein n=1 Tax=Durusdinium trenchii TaxID=1381693 RepID=A0ABP0HP94_9DINO
MEPSDCEERCKDFKTCTFYWTGTSHGATTCRLYEGCDSLVREFGMEGDLYALPHNASCQVANPEGCWKTSLRKQFLTQKEGVSPSYTRGAVVMNVGGLRSWTGNSTGTKSRDVTYIEPFGNMSTIKLLGWSYLQSGMGFVRDVPGISTAVVEGLNPNKDYKYSIKQLTNTNSINNKVTVNHGSQQTLTQFSRRRGYNKEGTVAATPRGELVFDFEAPKNYPLNVHDRTSGTSSGTASESCRRRYKVTGCTCYAESGLCTGSKVDGANCYAYGTMDVHGATGKSISVRAKVRCMELPFANSYSVQTSSGPSFSFLESFNDTDEGDREVSLDAVGKARDEDDESEENLLESAEETEDVDEESEDTADAQEDEDEEGVKDFETGEQESEDGNMHVDIQDHSMSLLEEGESSASDSQGWRRRRRRRRRRRTRRRRSRRRRSRRRRSRRRRTLPTSVSSTCPSGEEVLSCNCYPDSFTEKAHVWTVTHHCKEVWKSGRSCHAKGGYAQAVCAKLPAPATRNWQEKDEGPTATCPSDRTLLGCWCKSTSHRGDNCARVWADGNSCRARANGVRAHTSHVDIHVTANCATMKTSLMILSELKIELQQPASLAETPVVEARAIGHLAPLSFEYMHLHQQCDSLLLMGGIGVEHCSRPNYRKPNYHPWQQKKVLPMSFVHGSELKVGCWKERFESFRSKTKVTRETLHCVNGDWFNSVQSPEMGAFSCEPCVLVGGGGYSKYAKRNEQESLSGQELYFFSRMAVRVYTELGSVVETSAAAHKFCLKKHKTLAHSMMLENEQECPEILAIQLSTSSEVQERMMLLLDQGAPDNNQCLEAVVASDGVSPFVAHKTCNPDNVRQEISPMAIPEIMWEMHSDADRNSGEDLHSAFSSYCGAHGALSSLSFGQIFGGDIGGTKSNCHFAPVIKFGKFVDSTITYDKTSTNWPDWNTLLADSPILCADGEALTGFKHQPASNKFRYECSRIGGLGAKYEYFSAQVEVKAFDANRANFIESLKMITVDCGMNGLLSGFHFEFSEGGRWARSKYTCSKAGGAPVVMEPSTMIEALIQDTEGVFCPKTLDVDTGRYEYENIITGDKLNFQSNGAWCVASDCSAAVGGATPVGVVMTTHEVLNVTDFDGHFEAKGVPKLEGDSAKDLAKRLKALKPPKRPAQPPKPSLQVYKAEMPQYAEECLNYQDLWKKIVETHVNEEKEEVTEEAKLEADPGTEGQELLDYHPCQVANDAGGIFGRIAGQSGQLAPENMLYSDWNDCMQGDINRDLVAAKTAYGEAAYDLVASAIQEGIKLVCAMPPDAEIAPLGAGVEVEPDSICDQVTDFVRAMIDLPVGFSFASFDLKLEEEGFNACNPLQVGFARVFCDIHCVRDAVIRGDRSILKNLEKATKISNDNMKKMVDWSTEANRAETEYLDKKIDHSLKVNTIYLEHISKNTEPILIKNTAAATKAGTRENSANALRRSQGTVSRRGTQDALQSFLVSAQQLEDTNKTSRLSQVQGFQRQVELLHESLKMNSGTLNRAQVVGRQIRSEVQKLQKRFAEQERALSIYRTHSSSAQKTAKQWKQEVREASRSLVSLDHLWWRLRNHLDGYLDSADVEIRRVQASFLALENYENCKSGFEELLKSYASSMSKMKKSHQKLKSTWREVSNLMGEMASIIRDGDLFGHVMRAEGCESPLAKQTLDQARFAVQGMVFLLHRFQAAGCGGKERICFRDVEESQTA